MNNKYELTGYDLIGKYVKDYWCKNHPDDVIVFFKQRKWPDGEWEECAELALPKIKYGAEPEVEFTNDFWEGQTEFKIKEIVPLKEIIECYKDYIYIVNNL